jgi:hypothetical protein
MPVEEKEIAVAAEQNDEFNEEELAAAVREAADAAIASSDNGTPTVRIKGAKRNC